jgi:CelD/BcsL family acetyltransferase involved in cellulose biosynthesis
MSGKFGIPLVALAAFAFTACPPPEEPLNDIPPAVEQPPEAMVEQTIEVTNQLDETLTVTARIEDREQTLGMVQPGMTEHFTVTGAAGTTAEIEARDEAGQVVERETISITRERRDWRIGERNDLEDDADATY